MLKKQEKGRKMSENNNTSEIQLGLDKDTKLFRNNVGLAVYNKNGRTWKVKYGVGGEGGSDLIGFHTIEITPEMVGRKMALFMAVEVKDAGGKIRPKQKHFIEFLKNAGCIALFAMSSEDVRKAIDDFKNRG